MNWFVSRGMEQVGPMDDAQLREMVRDGDLTPDMRLWNALDKTWQVAGDLPGLFPEGWQPVAVREKPKRAQPWKRYFARYFDIYLIATLCGIPLGLLWPSLVVADGPLSGRVGELLLGLILLPFVMVIDALFIVWFGNTPGKAIAGLRIVANDGERLRLGRLLKRNFVVYVAGLGLGIPLVSLGTLLNSHTGAKREQDLAWESATHTHVEDPGGNGLRTWLVGVPVVLFIIWSRVR
jgi:uncharacterized RDD family membrane protein YckC